MAASSDDSFLELAVEAVAHETRRSTVASGVAIGAFRFRGPPVGQLEVGNERSVRTSASDTMAVVHDGSTIHWTRGRQELTGAIVPPVDGEIMLQHPDGRPIDARRAVIAPSGAFRFAGETDLPYRLVIRSATQWATPWQP